MKPEHVERVGVLALWIQPAERRVTLGFHDLTPVDSRILKRDTRRARWKLWRYRLTGWQITERLQWSEGRVPSEHSIQSFDIPHGWHAPLGRGPGGRLPG